MIPRERAEAEPSAAGREAAEMLLTTIDNQKLRGEEAFQLAALDFDAFAAKHVRELLAPDEVTIEAMCSAWLGGVLNGADAEECCRLMLAALLRKALGE